MALRPRDLASRMAGRLKPDGGYLRETFTLPRDKARIRARDYFARYPKAAYMSFCRKLARIAGRRHRIYDATTAERRLRLRKGNPDRARFRLQPHRIVNIFAA